MVFLWCILALILEIKELNYGWYTSIVSEVSNLSSISTNLQAIDTGKSLGQNTSDNTEQEQIGNLISMLAVGHVLESLNTSPSNL